MIDLVRSLAQTNGFSLERNSPWYVKVKNEKEGFFLTQKILELLLDKKSLLFLSGGKTPKALYKEIAQQKKIDVGAVVLIDERYGEPFHENSNEKMIQESGLLDFLAATGIPFYNILENKEMEPTAQDFDETIRFLSANFQKSIGVLGVGIDGHTAGIAGNRADFTNPLFDDAQKSDFVASFEDATGMFGKRITMTFQGLSMLDFVIVLAFGKEKKKALQELWRPGSEQEIPARFFKRPEIASKTLLITDQKV